VPHHLIDLIDPDEAYSAGRWRRDALSKIREIAGGSKIPLLVGGTMLYYHSLTGGLDALPPADAQVRAEIDAEAARRGWPALHAQLERIDARTAQRVAPNDAQRIQRALEVWRLTGRPLSSLQGGARQDLPFELKGLALVPERAVLHERIAKRFDAMLGLGLVDEVQGLRQRYRLSAAMPSMRAVGYRQVWEYLEGRYDKAALRDKGVAATRQLAKRQLTWLRSLPGLQRVETGDAALERLLHSFL
jgi:tRNA dimethylallyltransferase